MTLINVQGHFSFFVWNKYSQVFRCLIESPGDLTKCGDITDDLEWPLKVISDTVNSFMFLSTDLKTFRGHFMPPQQHLYYGLARPADCSIFARDLPPAGESMLVQEWTCPQGQRAGLRTACWPTAGMAGHWLAELCWQRTDTGTAGQQDGHGEDIMPRYKLGMACGGHNNTTCMKSITTRNALGWAHLPPTTVFRRLKTTRCYFDGSPIPVHAWDFPDVIKFHVAALQCIRYGRKESGSVIRTMILIGLKSQSVRQCPDICRHGTFHPNPCTRFWVILHTDKQTNAGARGKTYILRCRR